MVSIVWCVWERARENCVVNSMRQCYTEIVYLCLGFDIINVGRLLLVQSSY